MASVLPIGGLKEKLLAAHRGGIKRVLIPKENERDLEEIRPTSNKILKSIRFAGLMRVLALALQDNPQGFERVSVVYVNVDAPQIWRIRGWLRLACTGQRK